MRRLSLFTALILLLRGGLGLGAEPAVATPQAMEFFEAKVRPVLAENCYSCHGPKRQQAGLRLDSRSAALKGSDTGPVLVPGEPEKSPLIQAVRYGGEVKMPPKGKLPDRAVEALTAWVKMGVPWPETANAASGVASGKSVAEVRNGHWAFLPVRNRPHSGVKQEGWVRSPVDRFVLSRLEEKGLMPSAAAERRVLIRRVTFDLIGLPPSPQEIDAFVDDPSPDAFAKVVDRLLASPHYGERWGRYWLDIARYADSKGYVFQEERRYPYAYTYRDYVVRVFNDDLPYDQFILQQLAADRLPLGEDKGPLAAMGFLTLGRRFLNNQADIIDDRIDVVSRGLLGLTVSCARCHDHKFDPIPTKDYYSLYGVFASSVEPRDPPLLGKPDRTDAFVAFEKELMARESEVTRFQVTRVAARVAALHLPASPIQLPTSEVERFFNRADRERLRALQRRVDQWKATAPGAPPRPMMLQDSPTPVTSHVFIRGNPNNPGEPVPRQFLLVLAGEKRQPFTQGSGRLDLAQAIANRDNPLTPRVLVNRIWGHLFGAGLVRTPSDFGLRSEPPTHPELLDYLAWRFMEDGWSIKKLLRLIVLSNTYQQSSDDHPAARQLDPENLLLARRTRRRLDFEALRDSLLAVSGQLNGRMFGPAADLTSKPFADRRTLYGFIDRQNLPGLFRTFDFASPDTHSPQRYFTTVPQQALYLMNNPFVAEQARRLVDRSEVAAAHPAERVRQLYRLVYGRDSMPDEVSLGLRFIEDGEASQRNAARESGTLTVWEKYAQVLLLSNEFVFID